MRVRGDLQPSNAFTLEEQPKHPGYLLARFFENVAPFEETKNGLTVSGYEYDEYHLELADAPGLTDDILTNYSAYLTEAKLKEAEGKTIPDLQDSITQLEAEKAALSEKVSTLESQVTETQLALCDVFELALGG